MSEETQKHVFISYVRENKEQVDRLCKDLTANGINVWLDRNSIKPGDRWKDAIRKAIKEGAFFIACFSSEYASRTKSYMNEELTLAIEELRQYSSERAWFIPVLLSECDVPAKGIGAGETLLDINWVPLYEDWTTGIKQIISVIRPIPLEIQNLIHALHSENNDVRFHAVRELDKIGDSTAVPPLIMALEDEDVNVRIAAVNALEKVNTPEAQKALEKHRKNIGKLWRP